MKALIDKVLEASALSCNQPLRSHFVMADTPSMEEVLAILSHKRVSASDVRGVMAQTIGALLMPSSNGNVMPTNLPTGNHILEKKMAAGLISAPSIGAAKNQQTSAEYQLQQWIARYGPETASQRRNQIDLPVHTLCSEAFDKKRTATETFGTPMLSDVRTSVRSLVEQRD